MLKEEWHLLATNLGYSNERDMFEDLYAEMSLSEIAKRLNYSRAAIDRRINILGIPKRGRGGANNRKNARDKVWRCDQRLVFQIGGTPLAKALGVSYQTLYNYTTLCKKFNLPKGGNDGVLRDIPDSGTGAVCDPEPIPHGDSTPSGEGSSLRELLRRAENEG